MSKQKKRDILKQYKECLKKDSKLRKIMKQLKVDQESYLDALYYIEGDKIIPDKIYTDTTFQG